MTFKESVVQRDTARYCLILHWHDAFFNQYSLLSKLPLSLRCRCLQVLVVLSRRRRSGLPMSKSPRKKARAKPTTAAMAPSLQHPRPCIVSKLQWKASAKCRIDSSSQKSINIFCLPKIWTSEKTSKINAHLFPTMTFEPSEPPSFNILWATSLPAWTFPSWKLKRSTVEHVQRMETQTGRCKGFGWISFQKGVIFRFHS